MWEPQIPEEEVENLLGIYWQMLRDLESRNTDRDVLSNILVKDAYTVLNRCGVTNARPEREGRND